MIRSGLATLLLIYSLPVLAAAPVTGREQSMLFSRSSVQAIAAKSYHAEISQMRKRGQIDQDINKLKRIRRISGKLIAQAIRMKPAAAKWKWEIHLTSDPKVAAFSMSGGKLLIGSRFIDKYKLNDDEIGVALAHEIGHVIAEHVREQLSVAASFEAPVPDYKPKAADVVNSMESDIGVFFSLQPLSRLQELEADDIGIELSARAGIPPVAVTHFYSKIDQDTQGQSILDTHGPNYQRTEFIKSMADFARPVYEASHNNRLPAYAFVTSSRQIK